MTVARITFRSRPRTRFVIKWPFLYGFWATTTLKLDVPDRYADEMFVQGHNKTTLCVVKAGFGGRMIRVTLKKLMRKRGLKLWAWREATLWLAIRAIDTALDKKKQELDGQRFSETATDIGREIT